MSNILCFAGEVENAIENGANVVLFLNMPRCSYCKMFEPRFLKASQFFFNKYDFYKVDVESDYGKTLMYKYRATHVPFVLLLNNKKVKSVPVHCLMDTACFNSELENFK